ncbi:MAG TPA: hypothetical protein VMH35_23795 [Streptosporangiaceae bacterium]|nr:hypothetical protein [Streptosporangiaceae bacterium]
MISTTDVERYANAIMLMIREDQETGQVPHDVSSWDEIDDTVDANDYYLRARLPSGTAQATELHNAVNDEITRRLAQGEGGPWGTIWVHPDGHEVSIGRTAGYATPAEADAVGSDYQAEHGGSYRVQSG